MSDSGHNHWFYTAENFAYTISGEGAPSQPFPSLTASKKKAGGGAGFYRFPALCPAEAERCQASNTTRQPTTENRDCEPVFILPAPQNIPKPTPTGN
jgi:hypothetical protein